MSSDPYNEGYYRTCGPIPYSRDNPAWYAMFSFFASELAKHLQPKTVYDAGCAIGILVEAFRDIGIDATGGDISEFAISQVPDALQPHCHVQSILDPLSQQYDLITCIEVLEHIAPEHARTAISNLCASSQAILFSSSPDDHTDPTHLNVRPVRYWLELFGEFGFIPDFGFDASIINPHAFMVRIHHNTHPIDTYLLYQSARNSHRVTVSDTINSRHALLSTITTLERDLNAAILAQDQLRRSTIWRATAPLRYFLDTTSSSFKHTLRAALKPLFPSQWGRLTTYHQTVTAPNHDEGTTPRVLFISGDVTSPGHTYRVTNMARGLASHGYTSDITSYGYLADIPRQVRRYSAVIIWRLPIGSGFSHTRLMIAICDACDQHQVPTFFDIDDLVFDPALCTPAFIDGMRSMSTTERAQYLAGVTGYQQMMQRCGRAIVSTTTLQRHAEGQSVEAIVVKNALDERYETTLSLPMIPHAKLPVVIGYTPGSKTHQKDFSAAAPAIARILLTVPDVNFHILGALDLTDFPSISSMLNTRVFHDARLGRSLVHSFNATLDINISPLELNSIFTASKSELKYFEAGAHGVPTVASPVGPFNECITHGINGFLASNDQEWHDAIALLIKRPDIRTDVGMRARQHCNEEYVVSATTRALRDAIETHQPVHGPTL